MYQQLSDTYANRLPIKNERLQWLTITICKTQEAAELKE